MDPRPGLLLTCVLCYPYLSDSMQSFPRSTAHDLALAVILSVVWGAAFFWEALGKWLPIVHTIVRLMFALSIAGGTAVLYGTALYFMYVQ
jgi:hypothetical protein